LNISSAARINAVSRETGECIFNIFEY